MNLTLSILILAGAAYRLSSSHRPIIGDEGDRTRRGVVEDRGGERASEYRTGVKVEPVVKMLGHAGFERRVTVDDIEAMVALIRQEWLANPEHYVFLLLIEWDTGTNASVDKETLVVIDGQRQTMEPGEVLGWNRECHQAIGESSWTSSCLIMTHWFNSAGLKEHLLCFYIHIINSHAHSCSLATTLSVGGGLLHEVELWA